VNYVAKIIIEGTTVVIHNLKNARSWITVKLNNKTLYMDGVWRHADEGSEKVVYDEISLKRGDVLTIIGKSGDDFIKAKLVCCNKKSVVVWIDAVRLTIHKAKLIYFYTTNNEIAGYKVATINDDSIIQDGGDF